MIADGAALRLGGLAPARVVEPADAEEMAAILATAMRAGEAVVLHGGGTLQGSANVPARYDVAVVTRRLTDVHDYEPRDLTIGAGAGLTVAALQRLAGEHRQMLPLDAPFPARATLGGTLAGGWLGPRRATYGRARDLLIGATVALADGTLAKSGGMVVKNVTGYDVAKLYVGSHGTLGAFVRANFKLLPAPAAQRLATSTFDDDVRERVIAHTSALAVAPAALLVRDGFQALREGARPEDVDFRPQIVALFDGSEGTVERGVREYRSALGAAGVAETRIRSDDAAAAAFQSVVDEYLAVAGEISFTLIGRGLPSDAPQRAQRARAALAGIDALAGVPPETVTDLATGDVLVRVRGTGIAAAEAMGKAAAAVRAALGRAHLLAARGVLLEAWGDEPSTIATMRALKAQFDPHATLAPGRFVGGI